MHALFDRCGMVGQQGHGYRERHSGNGIEQRAYDAAVNAADGFEFGGERTVVPRFVAGFDVEVDVIVALERLDGGGDLALIVGVDKPGGAFDFYGGQPCVASETADEVDG